MLARVACARGEIAGAAASRSRWRVQVLRAALVALGAVAPLVAAPLVAALLVAAPLVAAPVVAAPVAAQTAALPTAQSDSTSIAAFDSAFLSVVRAHPDSSPSDSAPRRNQAARWIAQGALLLGAAALDRPMRRALRGGDDSPVVRDLSRTGNALGPAAHLVPAMAGTYVIARLGHSPRIATGVLDVAVGYTVADITEGLLKTAVGRERPFLHGDPTRFHPFTAHGDYHSFPSAHVTHITSIASAAAMEWPNPYVRSAGTAASVLVMWQRVHADQHWTSDVVAGAILGHALGEAAVREMRVLRRHH